MANREELGKDDRVSHISNLKVVSDWLHSHYTLTRHNEPRGETGLLRVFSLVPNNADLPRFDARVDDGAIGKRREPDLDIEVSGVSEAIRRDFKACRNGYAGHHTDRSPNPTERIFDVKVTVPDGDVLRGTVSFNITWSVHTHAKAEATVSVSATVIRADGSIE